MIDDSQLDELQELELPLGEKRFVIRTSPFGDAGRAIQAVGVTLGPSVRLIGGGIGKEEREV